VPLTLQIGARKEPIYRPYRDSLFTDAKHPPKYFKLSKGNKTFGFAWVCINGRRVIADQDVRGLLLKKFDFSIGTRGYLERFFKRTVFHRRITGEIIIQNPAVLPNAARSDLENNSARQDFLEALASFVGDVERWANDIQERSKAEEVLSEVRDKLEGLANELPKIQRDKEAMLQANVRLAEYERQLRTHRGTLQGLARLADDLSLTTDLLKNCKSLVADALKTTKEAQKKVEQDVIKVVQSEAKSKEKQRPKTKDAPADLVTALQHCGINLSDDAQRAIRLFESELLVNHLKQTTYVALLSQLVDLLEEEL
jgi:Tfp pilus assembly protein PilN